MTFCGNDDVYVAYDLRNAPDLGRHLANGERIPLGHPKFDSQRKSPPVVPSGERIQDHLHFMRHRVEPFGDFHPCRISINLIISITSRHNGSIAHIWAEYETLEKNMIVIKERCKKRGDKEVRLLSLEENEEVEGLLVKNVKHHQRIIQSVYEMESISGHPAFGQFALTGNLDTLISVELILNIPELRIKYELNDKNDLSF